MEEKDDLVDFKDLINATKNMAKYMSIMMENLNTSIKYTEYVHSLFDESTTLKNLIDYTITDKVIDIVKRMSFDQRIEELNYFKENNEKAYEMMKEVLESLDLGYGEKTKEMVEIVDGYDMRHLV